MNVPSSPLGLPPSLHTAEAARIVVSLSAIWKATLGVELGTLDEDLERLRRWFDPVAQGQRLRRELPLVPSYGTGVMDPGPPLTFPLGELRALVTPEGRCVLDLLTSLPSGKDHVILGLDQVVPYERVLCDLYRRWSRHRIQSVLDLLAGSEKPLQIAAAGVLVALLINRSTAPSRAMKRFPTGRAQEVVDRAFFRAVTAFTQMIAPRQQRATRDPRLISGWMLYEARRRLGDEVLVLEASRPDTEGRIWIEEKKESVALDVLTRDLSRGHRTRIAPELLADALAALVQEFRAELPSLAGFGLAHERPANTDRLCQEILNRYVEQLEDE